MGGGGESAPARLVAELRVVRLKPDATSTVALEGAGLDETFQDRRHKRITIACVVRHQLFAAG